MVRYIKDGAYTIRVETPPNEETIEGSVAPSEDELSSALERKEAFELEECAKEIDFTNVDFILQNLQLATPDYGEDKTCMLTGRKELVDIICSQICFYCYCALFALESKAIPVSILIIGDGFIGSNVITSLVARGCGSMLRVFTRSDTRAAEWKAKDIKSDCSIMQLLGGQRPDIIIPCVENSSFNSLCKQLMDQNIVTESSFIITPTFGFQRKKLLNNLKCSSIFRTFVEPQRIVRKYRISTVARRMQMMALLVSSGQEVPVVEEEQSVGPPMTGIKTRDNKLMKSVLWGGDIDDSSSGWGGKGGDNSFLMRSAMENILEGVETGTDTVTDAGSLMDLPMSSSEEGAQLLRERLRRLLSLVQLLENYYFIHGMMHHEARMTAVLCVFGFHEKHVQSATSPVDIASSDMSGDDQSVLTGRVMSASTNGTGMKPQVQINIPLNTDEAVVSHDEDSVTLDPSLSSHPHHHSHHHHHKHHAYTHNHMRRSKVAPRIKLAVEQAIDVLYAGGVADYHKAFRQGRRDEDLLEMLHHYPPLHQFNLDQQSFLANHAAVVTPARSNVNTPGSAKSRQIPKQDRHKPFMYDDTVVASLFAEDEDYAHMDGPGFDFMRQLDAASSTPRSSTAKSTSRLALDVTKTDARDDEDITSLVRLLEVAKEKNTALTSTLPPVSAINRGGEDGENPDSMGKRMFRKHSLYNTDLHKTTVDVSGEDPVLDNEDFTQIMSSKASFAIRRQQQATGAR